jgi:tetratricopeptide (TPR) repeat protein
MDTGIGSNPLKGEKMRKIRPLGVFAFIAAFILASFYLSPEALAGRCEEPVAVAVSVQGDVKVKHEGEEEWIPVRLKDAFCPGDTLRAMERSRADLLLVKDVLLGGAYFMSRTPHRFKVETPFLNAGVEGTEFFFRVEKDKAFLTLFEGKLTAANDLGQVTLGSGQSVLAEAGQPPVLQIVARPRDAVQWTLFYPSIVAPRPGAPSEWQGRAAFLLSVGRVEEASAEIEDVLRQAPGNADALALQSIIAVAQNEKESALELAKRAVDADPKSAAARIALSYAQQSNFDLEGALSSLREAVKSEPENALARARLSELLLSFGYLDEALSEAKKAAAQTPGIARTQTVLGFAYLAQIKTKDSRVAFERAIELDQADPLPRLGLGLATIRDGDVSTGRAEIEIAASLDPNNSLIRSYLAKAYHEEKRDKHASSQFTMAKEFDPNDPTPFFYDAIRKQTLNRPVEALNDLQKSISLNDNRAIYRSRLLLDEDLAARSASLGRIFSDLGFQQLALVEGWKSVNTDPANYSAHRFLADSYASLPRHEIARVSELLQSQLLQPINITPVQTQLGESDSLILSGAGPGDVSFNEFNPLFNRNRLALQASGVLGNNDTQGEEIVHSAVCNRLSYSLGQFHFETDGFRSNDDLKEDIYTVFLQGSLTHKTSIQAEFRYRDTDKGDLTLRFHPDDFSRAERQEDTNRTSRFGFHHGFSPGSDLIGSFIYRDVDRALSDLVPNQFSIDFDTDEDSYIAEFQYLFRTEHLNVIGGAGRSEIDTTDNINMVIFLPGPPFQIPLPTDVRENRPYHTNVYLYSRFVLPRNITLSLGASADFYKDNFVERNRFNPKVGLTWNPLAGTTIRAAAIRVLKRTLITSQTIEPTQVAGFNQFFDDANGAIFWRYGGAIDQRFFADLFGGVEYTWRDIDFANALISPAGTTVRNIDWKERTGRVYLYWTPHPWFAVSAEYFYEWLDRGVIATLDGIDKVTTHRFPLGVNFFHPCGARIRAKASYIDQHGRFVLRGSPEGIPGDSGSDRFLVLDASLGYRLPKRWGILTVEAKNLLDKSFRFQDTDHDNPSIQPERTVVFKFTLSN